MTYVTFIPFLCSASVRSWHSCHRWVDEPRESKFWLSLRRNKTMRLLERFHSISTDLRMRTKSSFPMRTSIKVIKEYGWRCLRIPSPFLFLVPKNHRWPMSPSTPTPLLHYMSRSLAKCLSRCDREIFSLLSLPSNNLSSSALCRSAPPPISPLPFGTALSTNHL